MKSILVVGFVVLFAIRWLFLPGYIPTHDGEYHIIRFHEFETMLRNGYAFPRWAPDLNSGYGVPLFNFFYPLPNYFGVFYHLLGWQFPDALKLTLATGYILAAVFCFLWLNKLFSLRSSFMGTIVFAYIPYWFVDIFIRGSVGEVLAIAWALGSFYSIESKKGWLLSLCIALMITSHNILAMIFLPLLLAYGWVRRKDKIQILSQIGLGIGLSAYFWLPALAERGYVRGLNMVNFRDHFPFLTQLLVPSWGSGFSVPGVTLDEMSYQIGIVPFVTCIIGGFIIMRHKGSLTSVGKVFIIIGLISFFLMQESFIQVWETFSFLQYIQYPWRLISLFLPVTAFFSAIIIERIKTFWIAVFLAIFSIIVVFPYTQPVVYSPRSDLYYLSRREFTDGTSSLGNSFSTLWSPWKRQRPKDKVEILSGDASIQMIFESPLVYKMTVAASSQLLLRLNVTYFPDWEVLLDGKASEIRYKTDGIITTPVPPGTHTILIQFRETSLRRLANGISVVSLLWIIGSGILIRIYAYRYRRITSN